MAVDGTVEVLDRVDTWTCTISYVHGSSGRGHPRSSMTYHHRLVQLNNDVYVNFQLSCVPNHRLVTA